MSWNRRWVSAAASVILLDLAIFSSSSTVPHSGCSTTIPTLTSMFQPRSGSTPREIILSLILKMAIIMVLGAPPVGVLIFEILLNATAMFNHANAKLPGPELLSCAE